MIEVINYLQCNAYLVLILMIFMHIIEDFHMQGILASLKSETWWKDNYPDNKYRYDYIICLLLHSIEWTIFIMFIPFIVNIPTDINMKTGYISLFIINTSFHAYIDNLKANKGRLNLIQDQILHLIQILFTWSITNL
jgi:hypothetical protein